MCLFVGLCVGVFFFLSLRVLGYMIPVPTYLLTISNKQFPFVSPLFFLSHNPQDGGRTHKAILGKMVWVRNGFRGCLDDWCGCFVCFACLIAN